MYKGIPHSNPRVYIGCTWLYHRVYIGCTWLYHRVYNGHNGGCTMGTMVGIWHNGGYEGIYQDGYEGIYQGGLGRFKPVMGGLSLLWVV